MYKVLFDLECIYQMPNPAKNVDANKQFEVEFSQFYW